MRPSRMSTPKTDRDKGSMPDGRLVSAGNPEGDCLRQDLERMGGEVVDEEEGEVPRVLVTPEEAETSLLRQNSLGSGSSSSRRGCVVHLDGHRYTIDLITMEITSDRATEQS
ncbi:hypothetical protein ACOMHN_049513 [Nucella lapillus]